MLPGTTLGREQPLTILHYSFRFPPSTRKDEMIEGDAADDLCLHEMDAGCPVTCHEHRSVRSLRRTSTKDLDTSSITEDVISNHTFTYRIIVVHTPQTGINKKKRISLGTNLFGQVDGELHTFSQDCQVLQIRQHSEVAARLPGVLAWIRRALSSGKRHQMISVGEGIP